MRGARVRVVDPVSLEDCPVGQRGEVLVAGSRIMKGYWPKPGQTAEIMLLGGWLGTGDGGSFDADGFLYLHDRLKDMIVSGGENVYPAEVESVMTGHPAVAEVAVVGVPSANWGESPYHVHSYLGPHRLRQAPEAGHPIQPRLPPRALAPRQVPDTPGRRRRFMLKSDRRGC
jgi:acyl-CoA synthetase (AMP-forming)/AMP-acid ligase II